MGIIIKRLTPDLVEDYIHFFDITPHWDYSERDELPCYCVTWRSDDSFDDDNPHWYFSREERREKAISFVKGRKIQGYLAYDDERVVGWCNATDDCQGGVNYFRSYYPIEEYGKDIRVKSIFCLMIAPDMKRKGIATQLVERVCIDAKNEGFNFVEAYPNVEYTVLDHKGPLTMYEKFGFTKSVEQEGRVVVRKELI